MCTASKSNRSSAATSAAPRDLVVRCASPGAAAPGSRNSCSTRPAVDVPVRVQHEARLAPGRAPRSRSSSLERVEQRARRTSRCRRSRRAGCAARAARAARPASRSCSAELERRERDRAADRAARSRVLRRPEERVARVDERRAAAPALALLVAERHAAAVVHERRVLDEVTQPERASPAGRSRPPRRSRGRTSPRRAGRTGRAPARVTYMQKPTPVITSGSSRSECSAHERRALVDPRVGARRARTRR